MTDDGLSVGVDLVDVARFRAVAGSHPRVLDKLFSPAERAGCLGPNRMEQLAARFAAKEAAFKALGSGYPTMGYRDVIVAGSPSGKPHLELRGRALELARGRSSAVSITHSAGLAFAEVILS